MKRLAALFTIVILIAAACGESGSDSAATAEDSAGVASAATATPEPELPTATPTVPPATPTATEPERDDGVRQVVDDDDAAPLSSATQGPTATSTASATATATPTAAPASPTPTVEVDTALLPDLPPVPEVTSCEHAADLAIERIQIWLDSLGVMPDGAVLGETPMPEAFDDFLEEFEAQMSAIESAAYALGCADDQMRALILERMDQLEAHNPIAEDILEEMQLIAAAEEREAAPTATQRPIDLDWDIQTCEAVAESLIDRLQLLLYDLDDAELSDFTGDVQPEAMTSFEQDMERLGTIADELGCDSAELNALIAERADRLVARGPVSQLLLQGFLEAVADGELFPLE